MNLKIKISPTEFRELIKYLLNITNGLNADSFDSISLRRLTLKRYLAKWTHERLQNWQYRRADKEFSFTLPFVEGVAIYQELLALAVAPTVYQRLLLGKIDQALVNINPGLKTLYLS